MVQKSILILGFVLTTGPVSSLPFGSGDKNHLVDFNEGDLDEMLQSIDSDDPWLFDDFSDSVLKEHFVPTESSDIPESTEFGIRSQLSSQRPSALSPPVPDQASEPRSKGLESSKLDLRTCRSFRVDPLHLYQSNFAPAPDVRAKYINPVQQGSQAHYPLDEPSFRTNHHVELSPPLKKTKLSNQQSLSILTPSSSDILGTSFPTRVTRDDVEFMENSYEYSPTDITNQNFNFNEIANTFNKVPLYTVEKRTKGFSPTHAVRVSGPFQSSPSFPRYQEASFQQRESEDNRASQSLLRPKSSNKAKVVKGGISTSYPHFPQLRKASKPLSHAPQEASNTGPKNWVFTPSIPFVSSVNKIRPSFRKKYHLNSTPTNLSPTDPNSTEHQETFIDTTALLDNFEAILSQSLNDPELQTPKLRELCRVTLNALESSDGRFISMLKQIFGRKKFNLAMAKIAKYKMNETSASKEQLQSSP